MTSYTIGGKAYPMVLTLWAMGELDELCGGFEHVGEAFNGKTAMQAIDTAVKMLAILLRGGHDYSREMGEDPASVPAEEALRSLLLPRDITPVKEAIFRSMAESMGRTVEVEPDPKNADATPGQ